MAEQSDSVINFEKQVDQYRLVRPLYEEFASELRDLIKKILGKNEVRFSLLEHRCKTVESFAEKIQRPNKSYTNPIQEITDLCGIRVVLFNHSDLRNIEKVIRDAFDVDNTQSVVRGSNLKYNEFGYVSDHYIINIDKKRAELTEWEKFRNIRAEIQVRTILQHAWASISHRIDYKQESDVPKEFRRKLSRVSALLELADDQFAQLIDDRVILGKSAQESIDQGEYNLDINFDTLEQYIQTSREIQALISDAKSAGFKLNERDKFLSECIDISTQLDLTSISQVHKLIKSVLGDTAKFFTALMTVNRNSGAGGWTGSSSFFLTLVLLYAIRDNEKAESILKLGGWDPESTARVAKALRKLA